MTEQLELEARFSIEDALRSFRKGDLRGKTRGRGVSLADLDAFSSDEDVLTALDRFARNALYAPPDILVLMAFEAAEHLERARPEWRPSDYAVTISTTLKCFTTERPHGRRGP